MNAKKTDKNPQVDETKTVDDDNKTPQSDPYARQESGSGIPHDKHA